MNSPQNGRCRIVLTGGPGGGKTTAGDLFRREFGERVVLVPEAATLLFSGGFPRVEEPPAVTKDGGMFRDGWHAPLDELRSASRTGERLTS